MIAQSPLRASAVAVLSGLLICPPPTARVLGAAGDFYYLDKPRLRWTADVTSELRIDAFAAGNAVRISPDGTRMYATTLKGAVLARELGNATYGPGSEPGPIHKFSTPDRDDGWTTKCRTGIAFYTGEDRPFFVYGVEDEPPVFGDGTEEPTSRIVAMNHPFQDGDSPRWISSPLKGVIEGTPVISSDGKFVFVAHNYNVTEGHFSVLQVGRSTSRLIFPATTKEAKGPYAPLGIAHKPLLGKYPGGEQNKNDLVIWGHKHIKDDDVNWEFGWIYAFQFSSNFDGNDASNEEIVNLQQIAWSTLTRPVLSESGLELFFATSKSEARGWWLPDDKFNNKATWKAEELLRDESRQLKALPGDGGPVLSPNELLLFTTTTTNAVYALSAEAGTTVWLEDSMSSIVRTEARVSPDGDRVFFIGSDGEVVCKRAKDGKTYWKFDADATDTTAEFDLSSDGTTLYYSGNEGTVGRFVYALAVADFATDPPTAAPTLSPTPAPTPGPTPAPTAEPTSPPTAAPTPSPTIAPTRAPTMEPASAPVTAPPTAVPTGRPTESPTTAPPTAAPTAGPTTLAPTTLAPTPSPTFAPSSEPTDGLPSFPSGGARIGARAVFTSAVSVMVVLMTFS